MRESKKTRLARMYLMGRLTQQVVSSWIDGDATNSSDSSSGIVDSCFSADSINSIISDGSGIDISSR